MSPPMNPKYTFSWLCEYSADYYLGVNGYLNNWIHLNYTEKIIFFLIRYSYVNIELLR